MLFSHARAHPHFGGLAVSKGKGKSRAVQSFGMYAHCIDSIWGVILCIGFSWGVIHRAGTGLAPGWQWAGNGLAMG
jgi:hypothetical protein